MILDEVALDDLWTGEKSICLFVYQRDFYWVMDYKYNFDLDGEKEYRAYLDKGRISYEAYLQCCKEYRGGALKLSSGNFLSYLKCETLHILSEVERQTLLDMGGESDLDDLLDKVESYLSSGQELTDKDFYSAGQISSRLPMFYINFDRKIYMHMGAQCHEDAAYEDWYAKRMDFSFLIPDDQRYWMKKRDCWKLRYVQPT